nr:hypothetical protein [Desulfoluna sp.]
MHGHLKRNPTAFGRRPIGVAFGTAGFRFFVVAHVAGDIGRFMQIMIEGYFAAMGNVFRKKGVFGR